MYLIMKNVMVQIFTNSVVFAKFKYDFCERRRRGSEVKQSLLCVRPHSPDPNPSQDYLPQVKYQIHKKAITYTRDEG